MLTSKDKRYMFKGYKVKIKYNNRKSYADYINESIETSFVPKIMDELKNENNESK